MEQRNNKRKLNEIVDYILTWYCYGDAEAAQRVAYTEDLTALNDHDVVIIPNGRLGNSIVMPDMNKVVTEQPAKGKTIIRTDIVYNAFFFISRAEETYNTERDEHDRFAARFSILGHNNRMQIPMLDEHARLLMKTLGLPLPTPGFNHIYLTHDIDTIAHYRSLRGALGGIKRGEQKAVFKALRDIHNDPAYSFPWLIEQDAKVPGAERIYFVKQTPGREFDYPQYRLNGRDYKRLRKTLLESGAKLGVHGSYYQDLPANPISTLFRTHFLRSSLRQMRAMVKAGYTDDFTMGFADEAGFRLQTTRAVRWIDPASYRLTNLTLHPLTVMDCTLSNENYMNLTEEEAYFLCERLIEKVRMHHGDLCLLWHNNRINDGSYHRSLYAQIINYLAKQ